MTSNHRHPGSRVLVCLVIGTCLAPLAFAQVIHEPGHTVQRVGVVGSEVAWDCWGGVTEDSAGNLYVCGANSTTIQRKTPGGVFQPFMTMPMSNVFSLAVDGTDLYVGGGGASLYVIDLNAGTPSPLVFCTAAWGYLNWYGLSLAPGSRTMHCGTSSGYVTVDLDTHICTRVETGGAYLNATYVLGSSSGLVSLPTPLQLIEITPAGIPTEFWSPTGAIPDGLTTHPVTGEIFVACGSGYKIQRLDPAGTQIFDLVTSIDLQGGAYPTPLEFSRAGDKLYYGAHENGEFVINEITGFTPQVAGTIVSPAPGTTAGGEIELLVDLTDIHADQVTATFEYSTDGGVTYATCTDGCTSSLSNPTVTPTPALSASYIWDSLNDIALLGVQPVDLRLTVSDGYAVATTHLPLNIDNSTRIELVSPSCHDHDGTPVIINFTADDAQGDSVTATFEYSTDGGTSFQLCTSGWSSPLTNPSAPLTPPVLSTSYIWNSLDDLTAFAPGAHPVQLRVSATDSGGSSGTERVMMQVDTTDRWGSTCATPSTSVPGLAIDFVGAVDTLDVECFGDIAQDQFGSLYITSGNRLASPRAVLRMQRGELGFSDLTQFPGAGNRSVGLAIADGTLYASGNDLEIYTYDLAADTWQIFATHPGTASQLSVHGGQLLAGSISNGLFSFPLPGGPGTQIMGAGSDIVGGIVDSTGAILGIHHTWNEVWRHVPGVDAPGTSSFFFGTESGDGPDAICIHPVTGDLVIAFSDDPCGRDSIRRWNAAGTRLDTLVDNCDLAANKETSPLHFSSDGTTLFFGTGNVDRLRTEVFALEGFPAVLSTDVSDPAAGADETGLVHVQFDLDHHAGSLVTTHFEFSTDGGATFSPCTTAVCSSMANPTPPLGTPSFAHSYIWDSLNDGVGHLALQPVELRLRTTDGTAWSIGQVGISVENTVLAEITSPTCGALVTEPVLVTYDAADEGAGDLSARLEFSADGGLTFQLCTPGPSSPTTNPSTSVPSPATGAQFLWNSAADGVPVDPTGILLRLIVTSPTARAAHVVDLGILDRRPLCGDCDGSASITILDALTAARHATGLALVPENLHRACNVEQPNLGRITILDALQIARYGVGQLPALGCQ